MSNNPLASPEPPEDLALLDDPRLEGMIYEEGFRPPQRFLDPPAVPTHVSSHLFLKPLGQQTRYMMWINPQNGMTWSQVSDLITSSRSPGFYNTASGRKALRDFYNTANGSSPRPR